MMLQYLDKLAKCRIVLASASPRRKELLANLGLKPEVCPSSFNEDLDKSLFATAGDYAAATSRHKAVEVCSRFSKTAQEDGSPPPHLIIAADTVVEIQGRVLEKPLSHDDAFDMLTSLAGRLHSVYTGVTLVLPLVPDLSSGEPPFVTSFHEKTEVEFGALSCDDIRAYVNTGEPMDKAGGYGIQGLGSCLVKSIDGCYFNVMGLPIHRLSQEVGLLIANGKLRV